MRACFLLFIFLTPLVLSAQKSGLKLISADKEVVYPGVAGGSKSTEYYIRIYCPQRGVQLDSLVIQGVQKLKFKVKKDKVLSSSYSFTDKDSVMLRAGIQQTFRKEKLCLYYTRNQKHSKLRIDNLSLKKSFTP